MILRDVLHDGLLPVLTTTAVVSVARGIWWHGHARGVAAARLAERHDATAAEVLRTFGDPRG